jgi:hypothetical protein
MAGQLVMKNTFWELEITSEELEFTVQRHRQRSYSDCFEYSSSFKSTDLSSPTSTVMGSSPVSSDCSVAGDVSDRWADICDSDDDLSLPPSPPLRPQGLPGNFALQGPPGNWVSSANAFVEQGSSSLDAAAEVSDPTTLLVSNLPRSYNRTMFEEMLGAKNLLMDCDLVYLPVEFKVGIGYGYAFVNFVSHQAACAAMEVLEGFADFSDANLTEGALQARWSAKQGLSTHIELYRNSPVMHKSVDDDAKPALLKGSVRLPFPEPTRRLRAPRARRALLPQSEAEATQVAWREPLAI